jgi:hypothetical protein
MAESYVVTCLRQVTESESGPRRDKMFISHAEDLNIHANAQHR